MEQGPPLCFIKEAKEVQFHYNKHYIINDTIKQLSTNSRKRHLHLHIHIPQHGDILYGNGISDHRFTECFWSTFGRSSINQLVAEVPQFFRQLFISSIRARFHLVAVHIVFSGYTFQFWMQCYKACCGCSLIKIINIWCKIYS